MIKLVYFASIREQLQCDGEELAKEAAFSQVSDIVARLSERGEPWTQVLQDSRLLVAVNQEMSSLDAEVQDGDEVAFFPPVTGG